MGLQTEGAVESSPLVLGMAFLLGLQMERVHLRFKMGACDGSIKQTTKSRAPNWYQLTDQEHPWIIVGSYDFRLHCIRSNDGSKVWDFKRGITSTAATISQGKTVFGGCDALLHVIDLKDGSKTKEIDAGAYIAGSAAMQDALVCVGHYESEFCVLIWRKAPLAGNTVIEISLTTLRLPFTNRRFSLEAAIANSLFGPFYGEQKMGFSTRGKVDSSAVILGGREVLFGSEDGRLYRLKLEDGEEIQSIDLGQPLTGSPAVVEGWVVIGDEDGHVYGFKDNEALTMPIPS